jgi:hypothetical protein
VKNLNSNLSVEFNHPDFGKLFEHSIVCAGDATASGKRSAASGGRAKQPCALKMRHKFMTRQFNFQTLLNYCFI